MEDSLGEYQSVRVLDGLGRQLKKGVCEMQCDLKCSLLILLVFFAMGPTTVLGGPFEVGTAPLTLLLRPAIE